MNTALSFGQAVRERRGALGLTQAKLARRAGCAPVTVRKIEADALRPSVQLAELLALALNVPENEQLAFVRLARDESPPSPLPKPTPSPGEIGQADLSGRSVKGFDLAEQVGSGGFGVVYRAVQPSVQRDVAVKIILPRYANHPDFIRRFEAEAHLVARLEHPHIVPLYDYWREPNAAYLIMRLLRGGSLGDRLEDGPLSLAETWRIVQQVGRALGAAHQHGVIHRDIKPANVLLDEDQNGYLADFGIAKNLSVTDADFTEDGALIGSPAYISPEQIKAEPVHPTSDIYCFGLLLYEMLSGEPAFSGPTPVAFLQQHLNDPLPSLLTALPEAPLALDAILQRATAKDAAERFADMAELLAALQTVLLPVIADVDLPVAATAVAPLSPEEIAALDNPYRGLRAFTEADAENFFGRETLVQTLLGMLSDESDLERFVAVVGPSGSGKSSVVKAGLLPALRRGGLPGSDNWFIIDLAPGSHPWEELEAALLRVAVNPPESLLGQLQADNRGLLRAVQRCLPDDGETELLLVIDQFEELFTLVSDEAVRAHFLQSLVTAVLDPTSRLRMVVTMRADFTDRPLQYVDFGELMEQRLTLVLPLTPDELTQAITGPVSRLGMALEPELVTAIVQDVGEQPGMLPLLQYALTELFAQRRGPTLTLDIYRETGGVTGALARRADEIYNQLDPAGQEATRQLFLRLITLGEGVEDTRRRVRMVEIEALTARIEEQRSGGAEEIDGREPLAAAGDFETVNRQSKIVNQFGKHRLLTFDHDPVTRQPTVEVAHEALLREWPRLRDWLRASREDVRRQRLLAQAAGQWQANNKDNSYLLRGSRLTSFEAWAETTTVALTAVEHDLLRASIDARDARWAAEEARRQRELETAQQLAEEQRQRAEEQSRSAQRLRLFAVGLAALLLAAAGIAWFANSQRIQAQDNFLVSERIRLASQAQNALDRGEGGDIAALLALRSLSLGYSAEADMVLQEALRIGFAQQQFVGHEGAVWTSTFFPGGRLVLTAGEDTTVRIWDAQTGDELTQFNGHQASVNVATLSKDEQFLASISFDNTVRIWNVATGEELERISGLDTGWGVWFVADDQQLLINDVNTVKLWDRSSGQFIREFVGHTGEIYYMAISPDEQYLATVSNDATVRLWDIVTGEEIRQFIGHEGWVGGADFSPDGRYLLTTGADGVARIWDVETGFELRRFVGHTSEIFDGRFSPDGQYVATSGYDGTARIWDVETSQELRLLRGHTNTLGEINFSPDGRLLITGSEDNVVRIWDVWPETEPKKIGPFGGVHTQSQSTLTLSDDGRYTLIGRSQGAIELWDNETGEIVNTYTLAGQEMSVGAFSPDNQHFFMATSDGSVHMWEIDSGLEVYRFAGHAGYIRDVVLSQDGTRILTGGNDGTVRLWDVNTGEELMQLSGHTGPVHAVDFSPEGQAILSGGADGFARIWDMETGELLHQIDLPGGAIRSVAFVPAGDEIVVGTDDNLITLLAIETGSIVRQFTGHIDVVTRLDISPDGKLLLSGSADRTVRVWELATGTERRRFGNHTSSILFATFSADGQSVMSGETGFAYVWRTSLAEMIAFACEQLGRDFTEAERVFYSVDTEDTCGFGETAVAQAQPTWTPIAATPMPVDAVQTVIEMEFIHVDPTYIEMGLPMQNIYIQDENGMVIRPDNMEPDTLAQQLFSTADAIPNDYIEPPFDQGPYAPGQPLGFSLSEWLSATGSGSYTQTGARAEIDVKFENLVPNGMYTLWCVTLTFPEFDPISELPCGALDGSENMFVADENGYGEIALEMAAFPPPTDEIIYEIAVAYHSDGQTYGSYSGDFSRVTHTQVIYDFFPPE